MRVLFQGPTAIDGGPEYLNHKESIVNLLLQRKSVCSPHVKNHESHASQETRHHNIDHKLADCLVRVHSTLCKNWLTFPRRIRHEQIGQNGDTECVDKSLLLVFVEPVFS